MTHYVAKVLCDKAGKSCVQDGAPCRMCDRQANGRVVCTFWRSFIDDADAAIRAVRDHAMLTTRRKPRESYSFSADEWAA